MKTVFNTNTKCFCCVIRQIFLNKLYGNVPSQVIPLLNIRVSSAVENCWI